MRDLNRHISVIQQLREEGFCVEMDDFGSGISSLSMLNRLKVDVLKLDVGFLHSMLEGDKGISILKTIISLARDVGAGLVVEGVETKQHMELLTGMGCTVFQGYYFSRPLSIADFDAKYRS